MTIRRVLRGPSRLIWRLALGRPVDESGAGWPSLADPEADEVPEQSGLAEFREILREEHAYDEQFRQRWQRENRRLKAAGAGWRERRRARGRALDDHLRRHP